MAGSLLATRTTAVWSVIVLATVVSWWLGTDHGMASESSHTPATLVIFAVAMLKVRLVGLYFMELRGAHVALRGLFETYCALVCAALILAFVAF